MEKIFKEIKPVENEIAGMIRGASMSFELADSGNVNPHYKPYTATADNWIRNLMIY